MELLTMFSRTGKAWTGSRLFIFADLIIEIGNFEMANECWSSAEEVLCQQSWCSNNSNGKKLSL